jgi:hypothetical protein
MRPRIRVESLVLPRLLATVNELYAVSEAVTTIALKPVVRGMLHPQAGASIFFATLARTAALFLVDYQEFAEATQSAAEYGSPRIELPPLPYPRLAVECADDAVWQMGDEEGHVIQELEFFMINEVERGEEWAVVLLTREPLGDDDDLGNTEPHVVLYTLTKDGYVRLWAGRGNEPPSAQDLMRASLEELQEKADANMEQIVLQPESAEAQLYRNIPVEFAHLVNARGVEVEALPIPLPERRRWGRKGLVHPQVYFVHIGDGTSDRGGQSDREYHCRWLVRGHWRHYQNGAKSWVRPYVKGPAGAPWRGRPIYILDPRADG